jgi:hypothetical protein
MFEAYRDLPADGWAWLFGAICGALITHLIGRSWIRVHRKSGRIAGPIVMVFGYGFLLVVGAALATWPRMRAKQIANGIDCNIEQLAAAVDQHCLQNNTDSATFSEIAGPQGKWIPNMKSVDGERYPEVIRLGEPILVVRRDGTRESFMPRHWREDYPRSRVER